MTISRVANAAIVREGGGGTSTVLTFGSGLQAGDLVVIGFAGWHASGYAINGVMDSEGNTLRLVGDATAAAFSGTGRGAQYWVQLPADPAGTYTVTVDHTQTTANYVCGAGDSFRPSAAGYWRIDAAPGTASSTAAAGITVTAGDAAASESVSIATLCEIGNSGAEGISTPAATGYSSSGVNQDSSNYVAGEFSYRINTGSGAQSAAWTWSNSDRGAAAVLGVYSVLPITSAPRLHPVAGAVPAGGLGWLGRPASGSSIVTSLSAAVQLARSATAGVSVAVQDARNTTASLDVATSVTRTAQSSLDAALQRAASAAAGVDAATQIARTAGAGADTAVQILRSAGTTLDAVAQLARAASAAVDVQVQAAAALTTSLSVQVQAGSTSTTSLDAAVRYARNADAAVDVVTQLPRSAAHVVDVAVRRSAALTLTVSAAVQAAASLGVGLDVQVQGGQTVAAVVQAAVQEARAAALGLQVAIAQAAGASTSVSAAVALQRALSAAVDAAVMGVGAAAVGTSVYVVDASEYTDGPSGHGPTSAVIAARRGRQHQRINVASHGRPRQRNTTR